MEPQIDPKEQAAVPPHSGMADQDQPPVPEMCLVADIKTSPILEELLPDARLSQNISERMRASGYDYSRPVTLGTWEGQEEAVLVDGHTRLRAAKDAEIESIPAITQHFDSGEAAIEYAIWNQGHRRAWTDATILACLSIYHKSKRPGPKSELAGNQAKLGKAADDTAKLFGVGRDKIESALYVLKHGDEHTRSQIADGSITINKAYTEIRKKNGKVRSKGGGKDQAGAKPIVKGEDVAGKEASGPEQGEPDPKSPPSSPPNLVKGLVGTEKEKKPSPKEKPDSSVEQITAANILAKVKPSEDEGSYDADVKSMSDRQFSSFKSWLDAQDQFTYLLDRFGEKNGQPWTGRDPTLSAWHQFGWTKELIDVARDRWEDLEFEGKSPEPPDVDSLLECQKDVVKAAKRIIEANASDMGNGEETPNRYPDWKASGERPVRDGGNMDLSGIYGDKQGRIGYLVPRDHNMTTTGKPIKIVKDAEFPCTSQEWRNVVTPLFDAQPEYTGLTMYDENGDFVVQTMRNGGNLETYWVKPA